MRSSLARLCLVVVSLSTFSFSAVTWTTIDYPGALITQACGINSAGDIVGIFNAGQGVQSYLLSGGVFTTIQYTDANSTTFAYGINDAGDVVGTFVDPGGFRGGFLKQGSTFTPINFPGSSSTIAWGVNNRRDSRRLRRCGRTHARLYLECRHIYNDRHNRSSAYLPQRN